MNPKISVILLAGGQGKRMQMATPKQFLLLKGKPLATYSFNRFLEAPNILEIIVVTPPSYAFLFSPEAAKIPVKFALPGKQRQDSVWNGTQKLEKDSDFVMIHDAARPLVTLKSIQTLMQEGIKTGVAALGIPVKSTIKEVNDHQEVKTTLKRSTLFEIQTPQILKTFILKEGFKVAHTQNISLTDDVSLAELIKHPVKIVPGSYHNIKITTQEDLKLAEMLLS